MIRRPPRSTRTDTLFPYTTLFRSFSCAVGVPAACLPSGVPRVFLFQPDGTLRESNYGTDFRPVGSGNNQGGDGSTLNDTGTLQPGYKRYIANFLAHYDVDRKSTRLNSSP